LEFQLSAMIYSVFILRIEILNRLSKRHLHVIFLYENLQDLGVFEILQIDQISGILEDFLHFEFRVILTFFRKYISWGMNPGGSSSIFKLYNRKNVNNITEASKFIRKHCLQGA
jgi:hypothetical protein